MFIRAMVRIFSFGERWNVPFNSAAASLNRTFHLSPHENILTIALINIHYLYNICVQPRITISLIIRIINPIMICCYLYSVNKKKVVEVLRAIVRELLGI
jgi:hypothetical protein